jgi:2,3-bisphosphoglycerate-independent phosphoglycerate mutase
VSVVFVFIDGVGIGSDDPSVNPVLDGPVGLLSAIRPGSSIQRVPLDGVGRALDACLGVEGLPQSASGQTAILAGVNAPKLLGRHMPGFPGPTLRRALAERSLLKTVAEAGKRAVFANAYRPGFWRLPVKTRWRLSATTVANLAAGLPFMTLLDLVRGRAVYHDVTNEELRRRGFAVPKRKPEKAGAILVELAAEYDLVFFEYFETDRAGHAMDRSRAVQAVSVIERTIAAARDALRSDDTLAVVSDHGNVEDISVATHTRNPVPFVVYGRGAEASANGVRSIADVRSAILSALEVVSEM